MVHVRREVGDWVGGVGVLVIGLATPASGGMRRVERFGRVVLWPKVSRGGGGERGGGRLRERWERGEVEAGMARIGP